MSDRPSAESIFRAALDKQSPQERAAYLEAACAGDAELRAEVERLLRADGQAGDPPGEPSPALEATGTYTPGLVLPTANFPSAGEAAGTRIGPYKLLQRLGEGGMGTVWMAEQTEPVKRRVALKVIKAGMDSAQVVA